MVTERGLDRVVFFTDAVAAIAITLLVLPLVDEVSGAAERSLSVEEFLGENLSQLTGFAISFAVIARLWMAHHSLFQHVRAHSRLLVWVNFAWAFTIVILPLPTAVVSELSVDPAAVGFYIGTMAASSCVLTVLMVLIARTPGVLDPALPLSSRGMLGSVINSALFLVAFVIGVLTPVGLWALLALFLAGPLELLLVRPVARRLMRADDKAGVGAHHNGARPPAESAKGLSPDDGEQL
ncbi:putative membrane protein [Glaciihabitans tibetensis]|uniref:Putative membrane protein n=1 Tax=Glaciihabitans tibetensis TaxID=1266600 RepID=A0A2T0VIL1_9MICO|nr:TMEM175 family protein [Glaciihabitans tibetensis]PRY70023.1 putative membrane protein [Glaciihabitans tibetensis]